MIDALSTLSDHGVTKTTMETVIRELDFESLSKDERRVLAATLYMIESDNYSGINGYGLTTYDDRIVELEGCEYLVLTDDEAQVALKERIADDLWAFTPEFLETMTEIDAEVFRVLQEKCESSNYAVRSLVDKTCGLDDFVEQAVAYDGRGHFLNGYDGDENEVTIGGETYYLYRQN